MKLELESNLTYIPEKGSIEAEHQLNVCNICQKRFISSDDLRKHNKNHLFCCSDCNQAFSDQITLTKHTEEAHCHDKTFHCTQCDKSFKELRTLRLHLKIHNADYPEHCEVCKKGFRTKWQLKQHLMDHGGKRPYPCPECSFTCKTKQQLNEHRRKHSGEKAYSCPLCGTRFTYRNGLIKHTKLNRCPKKIFTSDGEKLIKKKTKSIDHLTKVKQAAGENINGFASRLESKLRSEKSAIDQKILDVIQKRSGIKTPSLGIPELPSSVASMTSIDSNNNQELLRRAALINDLATPQMKQTNSQHQPFTTSGLSSVTPASVSLPPNLLSSPGQHGLISSNGTTATFLTNSTDISSWAATLPAGTKVTVTHYDASKKSSQGQLVATPTHTETIIVTPPKGGDHGGQAGAGDPSSGGPPGVSLLSSTSRVQSQQQQKLGVPTSSLSLSLHHHQTSGAQVVDLQNSHTSLQTDDPMGTPSFSDSFAVDPNEILLKNKPIKQDPDTLPSYQEANFNLSKFKLCNLPAMSAIDVQLTAQALLMNVKPDPTFDPNLKIKKECSGDYQSLSSPSSQVSPGSGLLTGQLGHPENWLSTPSTAQAPTAQTQPNLNDIKKEVLDELFENSDSFSKMSTAKIEMTQSPPGYLVPQLSIASENEDSVLDNDDFYRNSMKTEPISPQSNSSGSNSDTDHDSFSFHRDLDTIVASFGRANSKQDSTLTSSPAPAMEASFSHNVTCKADFNLPDLDLDLSNFLDENISDINVNEQDFLPMRMDSFDACSEIISNV